MHTQARACACARATRTHLFEKKKKKKKRAYKTTVLAFPPHCMSMATTRRLFKLVALFHLHFCHF